MSSAADPRLGKVTSFFAFPKTLLAGILSGSSKTDKRSKEAGDEWKKSK
jgi:hypothetical protein